jgi:hypothetical protein
MHLLVRPSIPSINLDIHHARYRVALAILKLSEKELTKKKNGMGELMMYLKNLPDAILVPDVLMPAALGIKLKVSLRLCERACVSAVACACVCPCVCVRACFRCPGAAQAVGIKSDCPLPNSVPAGVPRRRPKRSRSCTRQPRPSMTERTRTKRNQSNPQRRAPLRQLPHRFTRGQLRAGRRVGRAPQLFTRATTTTRMSMMRWERSRGIPPLLAATAAERMGTGPTEEGLHRVRRATR